MLSEEQADQIKQQLLSQIESTFPEDKKAIARQQVEAMDNEELEEFLKQNNLIQQGQGQQTQCIFCSIASEKTKSYKIDENKDAIAVLEINPISKAHVIVVPKEHIESSDKIPKEAFALAEKIAKVIRKEFKPKEIITQTANLFGHEIINLIPVYDCETINSERKQAKPEELEEIQDKLKTKPKPKTVKKPQTKKVSEKNLWLPKRIP